MNWVFISLVLTTILQGVFCGISLPLFVSIAGRIVFMLRMIGAVFPFKISIGFEIAALFCIVIGMIFTKQSIDWWEKILYLAMSALSCLWMFIDEQMYLYITEDEDETR